MWDVIVVGSGNAALCAGIAAGEAGARVLMLEKAGPDLAGGNTKYTAGAMRFAYDGVADLLPLLRDPDDPRLATADFGAYPAARFEQDLLAFNDGRPLSPEQRTLIAESRATMRWLAGHDVRCDPIWDRQSFEKDGRRVFWGGLTLATHGEGVGLFEAELAAFRRLGGEIRYEAEVTGLVTEDGRVRGVRTAAGEEFSAAAVVLACGGFEASAEMRGRHLGPDWVKARVRGTPHNTGQGLEMAFALGARPHGLFEGCHATPMDAMMPEYGNLDLPPGERKHYRKICYFLGIMINASGERFVDEGINFRNYTYAQFGRAVLEQPGHIAWQLFDSKIDDLLYAEYRFADAHYVEADTIPDLLSRLDGLDHARAAETVAAFNAAVDDAVPFDPTVLDGKGTKGLPLPKSNWAQRLDTPPFRAYPVTGGITFTYGGVEIGPEGGVVAGDGAAIPGLFACGEMVGGVFFNGYPGGSGLTSGAVFGRRVGAGAAAWARATA